MPQSWCSTWNVLSYSWDSQCSLQVDCQPLIPIIDMSGASEPPSARKEGIFIVFIYWKCSSQVKPPPAIDAFWQRETRGKLLVPWEHLCQTSIFSRQKVPSNMTWQEVKLSVSLTPVKCSVLLQDIQSDSDCMVLLRTDRRGSLKGRLRK